MDAATNRRDNLRSHAIRAAGSRGWMAWLAEKLDRSPSQLSQIIGANPTRNIGTNLAREFEKTLGLSPGALDQPLGTAEQRATYGAGNTEPGPDIKGVPLISWVQAGQWHEIQDNFRPGEGEMPVYTTRKVGPHAYALRVVGNSMENPNGRPTYPEGSIIIVDPDKAAQHGSAVIVRLENSQETTFKILQLDAGRRYLKPLNPSYEIMRITEKAVISGVVVQMIVDVE